MLYFNFRADELGRPMTVVDVGANIGALSLPLAVSGHRVLSIEADPNNYACLLAAKRANPGANLLPVNLAATSRFRMVFLESDSAWTQVTDSPASGRSALGMPLVDIIETFEFADADLIKMDIEGSEFSALTAIEPLIANNPDVEFVYESNFEACDFYGHRRQDLARRFEDLGYSLYCFRPQGDLMRYASSLPQGLAIVDMLATKRDMSGVGYAPVVDYDYEWAELEIRKALNRPMEVQQKHALSDLKYCRPALLDSGVWKRAYQAYLKKNPASASGS
ncbi:FkbM family methyltransferase [Hyphomonas sp.]|uniref:FkbM family methyltransferase n=1 Tax=Hyphomonas sp. TaxID=87 RepID=UPI0035612BD9